MTRRTTAVIIGGGGFLGRHLIDELIEAGYDKITSFDLRHSGDKRPGVEYVDGDLSDMDLLAQSLKNSEVLFHCASPPYHLNDRQAYAID
jgi:nucleoside-diphosphate-sugar epimerase